MKKFKCNKNWIKMNDGETVSNEVVDQEEIKEEETKMGFVQKHKDKLIIGGLAGLASLLVGLLIANKISSDDEYEEPDDFVDEIDDPDVTSEFVFDDATAKINVV